MHGDNVGMIQRGGHLRFPLKRAPGLRVSKMIGQKLDSDMALQLCIEREIHRTHASLAELRLDAILADLEPRGEEHMPRNDVAWLSTLVGNQSNWVLHETSHALFR
jgi:hypothetical protein